MGIILIRLNTDVGTRQLLPVQTVLWYHVYNQCLHLITSCTLAQLFPRFNRLMQYFLQWHGVSSLLARLFKYTNDTYDTPSTTLMLWIQTYRTYPWYPSGQNLLYGFDDLHVMMIMHLSMWSPRQAPRACQVISDKETIWAVRIAPRYT